MLVDHHCHLDFPEFADDLAGVVARANKAGVGTLVTISTRIRKFDQVRAVAACDLEDTTVRYGRGCHPEQGRHRREPLRVGLRIRSARITDLVVGGHRQSNS